MANIGIGNVLQALTGPAAGTEAGQARPAAGGFGAMVREALQDTVDASRQSEAVSAKAVAGKADVTDVVTAVTSAEMALDTVVAVRDRVISAYQEIMRMPI
ncbi:flagellar hook-basal body complex protein FliE [Ferrovibrio sp.]|uniref:flagellar hook-basal body complex protein FliE n=1 Tax=Ferrovibrio sp. TaxID=1917215 RepID=UPI00311FCD69